MSEVEELESRVQSLPKEEFSEFRNWFLELENELWDKEIAADFRAAQ